MDLLVSRENSLASEDRITKPESQNTGMETTQPVRPSTTSQFFTPTALRMVSAMRLAAPLFSRKMPMIQPKPITTPILAIVLPKPVVTVLTHWVSDETSPNGIASTAIRIAEIISDGNACILVKMISTIITTIPISIATTGFSMFLPPYSLVFFLSSSSSNPSPAMAHPPFRSGRKAVSTAPMVK